MIRVRRAKISDREKWDQYVRSHPEGSPYHLLAWGQAVQEAYGFTSCYFIAENEQTTVGVLPSIHLRFPLLLSQLVSLPYCDLGGCLSDDPSISDMLMGELLQFGKRIQAGRAVVRGPASTSGNSPFKAVPVDHDKVRMLLDLPGSSEQLMEGFKSKLRSQVRKAEKNNLSFRWGGLDDLGGYYDIFSRNMLDLGSPVHAYGFFKAILNHYGENARLGLVCHEDKPIGTGIILMHGGTVSIPWASTLREYNRFAPNMLLYWNFLKFAADSGYHQFDFGRSSQGEGTYKFKSQWGALAVPLPWHTLPLEGKEKAAGVNRSTKRDTVANIWRKMPLPLANCIGPFIRKYINL